MLDTPAELPNGTPVQIEVDRLRSEFWQNNSASELAREQGLQPLSSLAELAGAWPEADSIDEFLAFLGEACRGGVPPRT